MALKRPKEVKFDWPQPAAPYPSSERSGAFLGPSGCGKTSTAIALLTGPYRDVYSRVYVMSPSCAPGIDPAWDAWRKHVKDYMKVPEDEVTMWSEWEPKILEKLIARHSKVNAHLKRQGKKKGYVICVLVDDYADAGDKVLHNSTNVLTSLFVRGRHLGTACWLLSQKLRVLSNAIRVNFCFILIWRLRNSAELTSIVEELDALLPRKTLHQMYKVATSEKHSFWYINLLNEQDSMWYKEFSYKMLVVDK